MLRGNGIFRGLWIPVWETGSDPIACFRTFWWVYFESWI